MKKVNYILSNINVLNVMLSVLSVIMFFTLAYPLMKVDTKVTLPKAKEVTYQQEERAVPVKAPISLNYIVVTEKNLFHPERRIPSETTADWKKEVVRPEIIYYGSVITSEKRIAYIEDKKNPYSTPGRGIRQTPLAEGAMIGGYTLKEVHPDTIVLVRDQDKMVINLSDQKNRQSGSTAIKPPVPSGRIPSGRTLMPPLLPTMTDQNTYPNLPPPIPDGPITNVR